MHFCDVCFLFPLNCHCLHPFVFIERYVVHTLCTSWLLLPCVVLVSGGLWWCVPFWNSDSLHRVSAGFLGTILQPNINSIQIVCSEHFTVFYFYGNTTVLIIYDCIYSSIWYCNMQKFSIEYLPFFFFGTTALTHASYIWHDSTVVGAWYWGWLACVILCCCDRGMLERCWREVVKP